MPDEHWWWESRPWKVDLVAGAARRTVPVPGLDGRARRTRGLRHHAFRVDSLAAARSRLTERGIVVAPTRIDAYTGKRLAFFADPDGLPLEIYEE